MTKAELKKAIEDWKRHCEYEKIVIMVNCFEQFRGYIGVEAHAVLQPLAESHEDLYDVKKEREQQREHARLLYMQGEPQKSIAGKVGVSAQTVTRWVADGGWEQARAAANITRPELVNKILNSINVLFLVAIHNIMYLYSTRR